MQQSFLALTQIGNTSSSLSKKAILAANRDNKVLKQILELTYNPYKIFNVGKAHLANDYKRFRAFEGFAFSRNDVSLEERIIRELYMMANRPSIDEAGIQRMLFFFSYCEKEFEEQPDIVDWIKKILSKDLRIGISVKTINAVFPNLIPEFNVQLAEPFERKVTQAYEEPKYDGVRLIAISDIANNKVNMFSRKGMAVSGYNQIESEVLAIAKNIARDIMLDGEVIGANFDATMNDLFSKSNNKVANYMVFDGMGRNSFEAHNSTTLRSRKYWLELIISGNSNTFVKLVPYNYYEDFSNTSDETLMKLCDKHIANGFEGAMIKDANSKYAFKRTYDWQKVKRFHSIDVLVVDTIEGTGKYEGMVGALVIEYQYKGKTIKCKVGSGFTDEQRQLGHHYWTGIIVEVKYQEITKDGMLRFPVFMRLRPDKQ